MSKLLKKSKRKKRSDTEENFVENREFEKSEKKKKLKKRKKRKNIDKNTEKTIKIDKLGKKLPKIQKKKKLLRYQKKKCDYIFPDGRRCRNFAVGKGTLCKQHGGDPVIKENLLNEEETSLELFPRTKFNPARHPIQFVDLARSGMSAVEIAAEFEVTIETINKWAETYESFNTAYEIGKAMHEAWWIRQGKDNLNERSFNSSLFKFLTMNKLGYSDKVESKSMNMNVHGVLCVPDPVSEDEWEEDEDVIDVNS